MPRSGAKAAPGGFLRGARQVFAIVVAYSVFSPRKALKNTCIAGKTAPLLLVRDLRIQLFPCLISH
jgi:hypothetical protein